MTNKIILGKFLIGSYLHGLNQEGSDKDVKVLYITTTSDILKLDSVKQKGETKIDEENNIEESSWELGSFLNLAVKSNPTVLEVFKSPIFCPNCKEFTYTKYPECDKCNKHIENIIIVRWLQSLFPYVWSSQNVLNSHLGYSRQQFEKYFDGKTQGDTKRQFKFCVAYLRILLQGIQLLRTGDFSAQVKDDYEGFILPKWAVKEISNGRMNISWHDYLMAIKQQQIKIGNIIDTGEYLKDEIKKAYESNPNKQTNISKVNNFILSIRKEYWE